MLLLPMKQNICLLWMMMRVSARYYRGFYRKTAFRVTCAEDAGCARRYLKNLNFDLMVLDVMMQGESGTELAQDLRTKADLPILMLTARAEPDHRISGLEAGADDYLAKPFEPRELLLRIHNILRRHAPPEIPLIEIITFGPFQFHLIRGELKRGDDMIPLTDREKEILSHFVRRAGQIVPRQELLFGDDAMHERTIDVQVNRLRRKIEANPAYPRYLQTVRGQGYRLFLD